MNKNNVGLIILGLWVQAVGNLALVLSQSIIISQVIVLWGIFMTIGGIYQNSKTHEGRLDNLEKAMRDADSTIKDLKEKHD